MKGDFSRWTFDPNNNFSGVLHQQGRVLLDSDWNDQAVITEHWQDTAARDVIGPGVAAVPADTPHAFEVTGAKIEDDQVKITLSAGRIWADGLLVNLENGAEHTATYLEPPLQRLPADRPPGSNIRDAVLLEVWHEAVNGFQEYDTLIEPALGGPDTTERVQVAMALRLLRLRPGQACENIRPRLKDDFDRKGHLTVSLEPITTTDGDCPKVEGGGYTGFEHHLYRIEIAQVTADEPMFKWSRFNGGLVGRGDCNFEDSKPKFTISANTQAIKTAGRDNFYLEVIELDSNRGHRRVIYGAKVHLKGDDLNVMEECYREPIPPSGVVFFRLWDDIKEIRKFPAREHREDGQPNDLQDGIRLEFSAPNGTNYKPGDYWSFPVRAAQSNPNTIIDNRPPDGIQYRRVPLAELHWEDSAVLDKKLIEECRAVFRPLTKQKTFCSYTVGDGTSSHGDYDSIQQAIDKLPPWGGEICLLPGLHRSAVHMKRMFNIKIKGCGLRTLVIPEITGTPIFHISDSWYLSFENLALSTFGGTAIQMEGSRFSALQHIEVRNNFIFAYRHAIQTMRGSHIDIQNNTIRMWDRTGSDAAILLLVHDGLIERNNIGVIPAGQAPPEDGTEEEEEEERIDFSDDCIEPEEIENDDRRVRMLVTYASRAKSDYLLMVDPLRARGGIQIGCGSERIKVIENRIIGGWGNGITLGSDLDPADFQEDETAETSAPAIENRYEWISGMVMLEDNPLSGELVSFQAEDGTLLQHLTDSNGFFFVDAAPGTYSVFIGDQEYRISHIDSRRISEVIDAHTYTIYVEQSEVMVDFSKYLAFTYDLEISRNEISYMGLSGIGTPQNNLADLYQRWRSNPNILKGRPVVLSLVTRYAVLSGLVVGLSIHGNHIFRCLRNAFNPPMQMLVRLRGEGGISLGMCEDLVIRENLIEDNGLSHVHPVCGIFVSYAAQADISHNRIHNNGPLDPRAVADSEPLQPGTRGGVILRQVSSILLGAYFEQIATAPVHEGENTAPALSALLSGFSSKGGFAVRMQANLIKQPVGNALRLTGSGQFAILENQFNSDFSELRPNKTLAGAVFIKNIGQPYYLRRLFQKDPVNPVFPSGNIIFANNQTRLGVAMNCWTSQCIITADDLGFNDNQTDVLGNIGPLACNTLLCALTLRASSNRLQEHTNKIALGNLIKKMFSEGNPMPASQRVSLFTFCPFINNTSNNQGNHCTVALSLTGSAIKMNNQALVVESGDCDKVKEFFRSRPVLLGLSQLYLNATGFI